MTYTQSFPEPIHLFATHKRHQFRRYRDFDPLNSRPGVSSPECEAAKQIGALRDLIDTPGKLPKRMVAD
jgi:hypothetical protein